MAHSEHCRRDTVASLALCAIGLAIGLGLWLLRTPSDREPWGGRFVAGQGLAFGGYLAALLLSRRRSHAGVVSLVIILAFALGLRALVWVRAPRLSSDVYRYIWDGKVINAGVNPYRHAPADPELRPLRDETWRGINFKHIPTIYPPAAQVMFAALWRAGGDPERTFRLAFVLFDLAVMMLLWRLLIRLRRPAAWLLAYAWHPLVITEFTAGAHVDAAAIFLLVSAVALAPSSGQRKIGWSAAALGLSIMTKGYALLALPFLVRRYGWRYLGWVLVTCAAVVAPFAGAGSSMFGGLSAYLHGWGENASLLLVAMRALEPLTDQPLIAAKAIMTVALLAPMVWLLLRKARDEESLLRDTFVVFAGGLLLGGPVLPWYVAWTVPFLCFWPVAGWVLFTGLASVAYYSHWSLPKEWVPLLKAVEYGTVYLVLAAQGVWWLLRIRRTGRAASARS